MSGTDLSVNSRVRFDFDNRSLQYLQSYIDTHRITKIPHADKMFGVSNIFLRINAFIHGSVIVKDVMLQNTSISDKFL